MSDSQNTQPTRETGVQMGLWLRAVLGGVLMGLANLVPGISGGTMLLAAGIYTRFVDAIAELSTLRFRLAPIVLLAIIATSAACAILLLAGTTKDWVLHSRWQMYSLFIGLTLGGVPILWRLLRPIQAPAWMAAGVGIVIMFIMAMGEPQQGKSTDASNLLLFLSGVAGASAMILPGISGGYLLLLLGQYLPILGAIDSLKHGDFTQALGVLLPVAFGVALGIIVVSNGLRWLLAHMPQATLGLLLGLLLGAVFGLWPFQELVIPEALSTTTNPLAEIELDELPLRKFSPSATQLIGSAMLILLGYIITRLIDRIGSSAAPSTSSSEEC